MLKVYLDYAIQILKAILLFTLILLVREWTTDGIQLYSSFIDVYHNDLNDLDGITIYLDNK